MMLDTMLTLHIGYALMGIGAVGLLACWAYSKVAR